MQIKVGDDFVDYQHGNLLLNFANVVSLPDDLHVTGHLNLSFCTNLQSLPNNLTVDGNLSLFGCKSLQSLPPDIKVAGSIQMIECKSLRSLPDNFDVVSDLLLGGCKSLQNLPDNLSVSGILRLDNCVSLRSLPESLSVTSNSETAIHLNGCTSLYRNLPNCIHATYEFFTGTIYGKMIPEQEAWCLENGVEVKRKDFAIKPYRVHSYAIDDPVQLAYYRLRWS